MGVHSSEMILVAVTVARSLEMISEYAISLARRIGAKTSIVILLVSEPGKEKMDEMQESQKLRRIQEKAGRDRIDVQYRLVFGFFPDVVAEYLYRLDCPLLVVGEGDNREKRFLELKKIESLLESNKNWHHRKNHHFLVISER